MSNFFFQLKRTKEVSIGLIITILLLNISFESRAQYWNIKKIDSDQGLSNSAVTSIFFDSKEYMWFGTWDGLNKYDGNKVKVFMPDRLVETSLGNNIIREIFEDHNNNLWIVTDKNINRYDRNHENFQVYLNSNNTFSGRERIIRSSISKDSTLWCSVYDVGIVQYSEKDNEFVPIKLSSANTGFLKETIGIKAFSDQRLALVSEAGNLITLIKEQNWTTIRVDSLSNKYRVIPNQHWFVDLQDRSILLMSLEGGGLVYVDLNSGQTQKIEEGNHNFIITEVSKSTAHNFLWLGTDNGKILKLTLAKKITIENADQLFPELSSQSIKILKIYEVQPNLFWIGTDGNGVWEYNTEGSPFVSIKKGNISKGELSHSIVRAIYEEPNGETLVGTRGNGLNILSKDFSSTRLITTKDGLSNNAVLEIKQDKQKNYWVGVDGEGIDFLEHESGNILHFPRDFINPVDITFKSVYSVCIDSYGDIWLGTSGYGIVKFSIEKIGKGKYKLDSYKQFISNTDTDNHLESNIVYSIVEDRPNFLWIGSRGGGLQLLNTLTNEFSDVIAEIDKDVISLYKSRMNSELWVGTSNGLFRLKSQYNKTYDVELYNQNKGLPNNTIHAVQEDHFGNIWISTNSGISNWDRNRNQFKNYNKNDGLIGNEFTDGASFYGESSRRLFFGGIKGLSIIEPEKVKYSNSFPRLALQELKLFNKLITPENGIGLLKTQLDDTDTLVFESDQNFFSISYAALNYISNNKSKYAYYLEGFDKDWNQIGNQRTAYFTNVPPGKYTLKLKCSNQDGVWDNKYRSIFIHVKPPLWKTNWAYFVYSILILALVGLIYFFVKKRNRMVQQLYFTQLEKQKIEEINDYKLRFFTNVSHEFRTPLSLILVPSYKLFEKKDRYPELKSLFENIYHNSNRLLKLIGELIEFRKAESDQTSLAVSEGDIALFLEQITSAFTSYAEEHNVSISFENEIEGSGLIWFDHDKLKMIMLNLISNAIKYNRPNGIVTVSVNQELDEVHIKVEDTGVGIPENFIDKVFQRFFTNNNPSIDPSNSSGIGLALTKSLIESHKGSIQVTSKKGEGSIFYVRFPSNKEAYNGFHVERYIHLDPLVIEQTIDGEFANFNSLKVEATVAKKDIDNYQTLLVVDDNEQFRSTIKEMFIKNYDIIEASNGAEALDIIKEKSIDLVISDVLMPEIDGYELCKHIKDDINTCHIPVILLTAMGEIENRIKGINIGADSYIPKPFHPKHLITRVEKLLESKEQIRKSLQNAPWKLSENTNELAKKDKIWLNKIANYIVDNIADPELDSEKLMENFAMSKTQLYRKMKAITGNTPHGIIKKYRLRKASELLIGSDKTISEIVYETGFNNRSYFFRIFKEEYNCSPSEFKSKVH